MTHFCSKWAELAAPKRPPGFFFFSIAMGADYLFYLNFIETYAPQVYGHNGLFLGSVHVLCQGYCERALERKVGKEM